jgi:hypothetical protein
VGCVREEIEGLFSPHGWRIAGKKSFAPGFTIPMLGGEAENLEYQERPLGNAWGRS